MTDRNFETSYDVSADGTIVKVKSTERVRTYLALNPKIVSSFQSILKLESDGVISEVEKLEGKTIEDILKFFVGISGTSLLSQVELPQSPSTTSNFLTLVKENKKVLANENIGKVEIANAFIQILRIARKTGIDEFLRVLNARTTKEYQGQIIDILGATQTSSSHEAAKRFLKFDKADVAENSEKYFQALAVGTRPSEEIIQGYIISTLFS